MWWTLNLSMALEALAVHRLRTALTTLGVVFGVAAVICMLAIGKGAEQKVLSELRRLGVRNLHVEARKADNDASSLGLAWNDVESVSAALASHIEGVAAEKIHRTTLRRADRSIEAQVSGVTPNYARFLDLEVQQGRFISDLDHHDASNVCVLSDRLVPVLFPAERVLGSHLRLGATSYRIVGIVSGVALANEERPPLYIPLSTAWNTLPRQRDARELHRMVVRLKEEATPRSMGRVVASSLLRRHSGARDFSVVVPLELIEKEQRTQRIFQLVMGSIAAISLLVGGIGITNIMFASVVERTSEIGLRRAVGARRRDVLLQFLAESAMLGGLGGLAGVGIGILGAWWVTRAAEWPVLVTPLSVALAWGMAIATGVIAGWVPAHRAAHVEAIVALHHE